MSSNDTLQVALRHWFSSALGYLSTTQPPLQAKRSLDFDEFGRMRTRVGGGYEPYIWLWTEQHKMALAQMAETPRVSEVVQALSQEIVHPDSGENPIISELMSSEHFYDVFLVPLLQEHLYADHLHLPTEASVSIMVEHILDRIHWPVLHFTPSLVVIESITAKEDFELEPGVVFRATTPLEKRRFYFGEDPTMPDADTFAYQFSTGYAPSHILEVALEKFPEATSLAESFVFACRLLGLDRAGYRYIRQEPSNPLRRTARSQVRPLYGGALGGDEQEITKEIRASLANHWSDYRRVYGQQDYWIIVSRYLRSFSRPSFEDQIVDLWVALESVFSTKDEKSEIIYRLSLRIARLLRTDPDDRQTMAKRLKTSYSARSTFVHGGRPTSQKDWEKLIPAIDDLRDVVGQVLKKMVEEQWQPDYPAMDFRDD